MERLFFELLQVAIGNRQCLSAVPKKEEWLLLFQMSTKPALAGIAFHGVQLLPKEQQPERNLILQWYAIAMQIQVANEKTNKATLQARNFFHEKGFRSCVLKGQGNSLLYPIPNIRMSGDIDLWVEGGEQKVLAFVKGQVDRPEILYHHVEFKKIDDIEIEVHYRPSFMNNLIHNYRLQRWFVQESEKQFSHEVEFPDGAGRICVPTYAFNRIYQMAHICNHVIHEGIGLRQIVDYYFVLKQGFSEEERQTDGKLLRRLGLYDVAAAVMYVLKEILLMEESMLLVPADERSGKFFMNEIMQSGNFGQYDKRVRHNVSQLSHNIQRLKRDFRLMWYFPSECLWEPIFRVYHFFWRLLNSLALRVEGAASRRRKNVKK